MANKTVPTGQDVREYLATLNPGQRVDAERLITIMRQVSGQPPVMWGTSIIGFGSYRYQYASGREGDWPKIGFAPRKGKLSLYITGDASQYAAELGRIGKHEVGKGCIYIKTLADIDLARLADLIAHAYQNDPY